MHWLQATNIREEMPLSQIRQSNSIDTNDSVNPGTSIQITSTYYTPPPLNHNINLPLGHPYILNNDRGVPPSYEEAIDPNAPPPSYDSLFGRMRETHKNSKGVFDFLKNILILLLGTIGCTIIMGLTLVIPIFMVIIGAIYLNDCPQEEYIPIYLLVAGAFSICNQMLATAFQCQCCEVHDERILQKHTHRLINWFMIVWFFLGSRWVYKEYEPNYDPAQGKYCNKTLYLFAFWLITLIYILFGVSMAGACTFAIVTTVKNR